MNHPCPQCKGTGFLAKENKPVTPADVHAMELFYLLSFFYSDDRGRVGIRQHVVRCLGTYWSHGHLRHAQHRRD